MLYYYDTTMLPDENGEISGLKSGPSAYSDAGLMNSGRTIHITDNCDKIGFYYNNSEMGISKVHEITQAMAALRKNSNEDNLSNLRKAARKTPIFERKNSLPNVRGEVTKLNETNLFLDSYHNTKKEYAQLKLAIDIVKKNCELEFFNYKNQDLYEKKKQELKELLDQKSVLAYAENDFPEKYKSELEGCAEELRIKGAEALNFYTGSGSDYINNFLEDKAANAPRYSNLTFSQDSQKA